jgi:hypothetical protein
LNKSWYIHYQRVHLSLHNLNHPTHTKIYSTERAFAALEANGSIKVWGKTGWGGTGAPDDSGTISFKGGKGIVS